MFGRRRVRMVLAATALVAIVAPVAVTTLSSGAPASAAVAPNPVGTYNHLYIGSNAVGTLTINADHTVSTSVAGNGHWTSSGQRRSRSRWILVTFGQARSRPKA